ncbi:PQQ-dependent sugar dehydrogenase [Qipengyuania vesicularis]|uniref:PQQ-dependent sugar dehydrogenase n=1 Tax=Qipengyuania vesicularis TaxID=2867232 RepID=UPI001C87B0EA|nr:PQQ-dependent sugar dehydrogenase [Qipengyuania vesicularis]MBX7526213.1 PQQ-dependent sugar dehydrogenase [Qipengyuania vesicularis]
MKCVTILLATLSPLLMASSCGSGSSTTGGGETVSTPSPTSTTAGFDGNFAVSEHGSFDEPWAAAFVPGTDVIVVTEKGGSIRGMNTANQRAIFFTGVPQVDYGGQGGLGDIAFLPSEASSTIDRRTIYLSWAEAGSGDTRGAVVGRGQMVCEDHQSCEIRNMEVIWRQAPKTTGRGHYSHRILFSPDERYMYVASGDRQKLDPAQDRSNTLGSIVRLNLDGSAAADNPFGDEIWSYGHRNILGMDFDAQGRLWDMEHGPKGGDELNLVKRGANYGWPVRSNGVHYNGDNIPDHSADDGFAKPAISWTPVIAPGNMVFYRGSLFDGMKGDALISGLSSNAIVRVAIDGESAIEVARYDMGKRIRSVIEGPDGALWVLEDGSGGRLLELRPQ